MERLIELHTTLYPKMRPRDAVKLIYQRELGCGHLLPSEDTCAERIDSERAALTPDAALPPCVPVGGGMARLDLRAPHAYALPAALLARMMALSAPRARGTKETLIASLCELQALTEAGALPFSISELDEYATEYAREGYPVVSHSTAYRAAYRPAYRVADARYGALLPVIAQLARADKPVLLVIDGMCASGKSTAAALLQELFGASVFHLDDYFLPPERRTEARLAVPGGNVDYERFSQEVLQGLRSGKPFAYQPYSCKTGQRRLESASPADVTIIEGAYSLHPAFAEAYQRLRPITLFMETDAETQARRILARNGRELARRFSDQWIPLEKCYFEAYDVRESANGTLRMEDETL